VPEAKPRHRGRRKRRVAEQALRAELVASREAVSALTDMLFRMENRLSSRLAEVEQGQAATEVLVTYFGRRVIENEGALTSAVAHVASLCETITERMASDRDERRALLEAITAIRAIDPPVRSPDVTDVELDLTTVDVATPTVLGGTFFAGPSRPENGANGDTDADADDFARGWRKWSKR
jgi:hypothetical protein